MSLSNFLKHLTTTSQIWVLDIDRTPIVDRATIFLQDFFTIDNTRPLAIIFFHQNKRPSPIKGPLLKIRLQDPLNVLCENSSPVHYWCVYGRYICRLT